MSRGQAGVLILVVLVAMGANLANDLVYDAAHLLAGPERFAPPIDWVGLATERYWSYALYRPLTLLVLGAQAWIGGGIVAPVFHAVSLVLYVAVVLLLLRLLPRLGVPSTLALIAAAAFAAHPVHVEVVASVVGQAEMLVAIAFLVALLTWSRASEVGPHPIHLAILALALAAAAFAKEQGFVLPVVLLGLQWFGPRRLPRSVAGRWLVLLACTSVALWALHWRVTGSLGGDVPAAALDALSPGGRVLASLGIVPEAARVLVFPLHLRAEYTPPETIVASALGWRPLLGAALLGLGLLGMWHWRRRRPVAAFGLWFAGVTWLPASSLVVPAGLLLGERVLFLPSLGLAIALGGWWIGAPRPRAGWLRVGWVLVALLALRSTIRSRDWHDQATFHAAMVRDAPGAYRAWFVRGVWQGAAGDAREAEASLRRALALWPRDPMVHDALGQLLRGQGRCAEAIPVMREGVAIAPDRVHSRARLGECLLAVGDSAAAREVAREGIARGDDAFRSLWQRAGGAGQGDD